VVPGNVQLQVALQDPYLDHPDATTLNQDEWL
jgi:hypothetical protein